MKKLLIISLIAFIPLFSMEKQRPRPKRARLEGKKLFASYEEVVRNLKRNIEHAINTLNLESLKMLLTNKKLVSKFTLQERANFVKYANMKMAELGENEKTLKIVAWMKAFAQFKNFSFPQYFFTYPTLHTPTAFNPERLLTTLINTEQNKIYLSFFRFTLYDVADALVALKRQGKEIVLIIDKDGKEHEAVQRLLRNGIEVYSPPRNPMHTKMVFFFKNVLDKSLLWEGSWNSTYRASTFNFETFEITDDEHAFKKYLDYFEYIKGQSTLLE